MPAWGSEIDRPPPRGHAIAMPQHYVFHCNAKRVYDAGTCER